MRILSHFFTRTQPSLRDKQKFESLQVFCQRFWTIFSSRCLQSFLLPRKRPQDAGFDQRDSETEPKHSNRKKSFAKTAEKTRLSRSRCFRSMIRFFFRSLLVFRARMKTPKILNAQRWNEHGLRLVGPGQKFGSHSIRKRLCGQTQG